MTKLCWVEFTTLWSFLCNFVSCTLVFPRKILPNKIKLYIEIDSIYKVFKGISKLTYLYTIYIQLERCNWSLSFLVS